MWSVFYNYVIIPLKLFIAWFLTNFSLVTCFLKFHYIPYSFVFNLNTLASFISPIKICLKHSCILQDKILYSFLYTCIQTLAQPIILNQAYASRKILYFFKIRYHASRRYSESFCLYQINIKFNTMCSQQSCCYNQKPAICCDLI